MYSNICKIELKDIEKLRKAWLERTFFVDGIVKDFLNGIDSVLEKYKDFEKLEESNKVLKAELEKILGQKKDNKGFIISKKEDDAANDWIKNHKCKIKKSEHRVIKYILTPTGIGLSIKVKCSCGKKKDVTDIDNW